MKKPFGVGAAERLNHKIEAILLLVKCQSVRILWWAWVDLNHRPRPYQEGDLRNMFASIIGLWLDRTTLPTFHLLTMSTISRGGKVRD